jgi:cation diffusion facilitator CzcD-associated flavoprotein CzcO
VRRQEPALDTVDRESVFGRFSVGIAPGGDHWHRRLVAKLQDAGNPAGIYLHRCEQPESAMNASSAIDVDPETVLDVLIVGAGISGIGMAAKLAMHCPDKRYLVLDRRQERGGTWDLFRYPGIRSDSDMHTFAYAFQPWREEQVIAPAAQIKAYLDGVTEKYAIGQHMRFGRHIESADWDSGCGLWRVTARVEGGKAEVYSCRFLFLGTGYYDYDNPHDAGIPGLKNFKGTVIHPQFWPEEFDYAGKRVIVIGSGATAVTIVPAMAEHASHVTMLQRTPTWYGSRPSRDKLASVPSASTNISSAERAASRRSLALCSRAWSASNLARRGASPIGHRPTSPGNSACAWCPMATCSRRSGRAGPAS